MTVNGKKNMVSPQEFIKKGGDVVTPETKKVTISLILDKDFLDRIDNDRSMLPGISRNAWIRLAIQDKLTQ